MQASREQYCVNKAVTSKSNKEEECDKLLSSDGPSCAYYTNVNKLYGSQAASSLKVSIPEFRYLSGGGRQHSHLFI